jgi:hypothetical protein
MFARGAAGVLILAVIAALGIAGATTVRSRFAARAPAASQTVAASDSTQSRAAATPVDSSRSQISALTKDSVATPAPAVVIVPPTVPLGRTTLRDTMVADRAGDTVRVSFDLLLSRTRRPDKFEAIVRSTLPQVYGAAADSALRVLPEGSVARAGDLMTTLPERGFRIPLSDGRTIAVWPETRAGRDGPLVVAYRAVGVR